MRRKRSIYRVFRSRSVLLGNKRSTFFIYLFFFHRSVAERAVLEQIVSETRPHLGLSNEEEQLMQSMADHYFEQGEEQGIEQGAHQMSIETTLNILTERFSNVDADALRIRFEAITDLNKLKQLSLNAALAESFNAFQEALNADWQAVNCVFVAAPPFVIEFCGGLAQMRRAVLPVIFT